jgi:hypothetical protein
MFKFRVSSTAFIRSLLWFAALILLPTWARAADISFEGGSGCDDPPIFGQFFTLTANSHGGFCTGFGNHSGMGFDSLTFVTTIPNVSPTFNCSPEPFFAFCEFIEDTAANTLTILFFGLDRTHQGIPVAPDCPVGTNCLPGVPPPDNFFINLNNFVCPPTGGPCAPPNDTNGTGDWLTNGVPSSFSAAANVPEPETWALLLVGAGALLARVRLARNGPGC